MTGIDRKLDALRRAPRTVSSRRRRRWLAWAAALIGLAVVALVVRQRLLTRPVTVEIVAPTVLGAAEAAAGPPLLSASGYVVARREAVVSSKIQGRLQRLLVEEGDVVRQGQVLATLEDAEFAAQVARSEAVIERSRAGIRRAEADLAEYRRQLRKTERLVRETVSAEDDLEAAASRVAVAEAALAQARGELAVSEADLGASRASLANTVIRAPFAGTVVKKMAEIGESVAPIPPGVNISTASGAIVALADLATLEVEVDVAESQVARLADEQPSWVTVEAFPERRLRGRLRQVIPTADRTKATVQVKVTILDAEPRLRPEMSAQVDFLETMPDVEALSGAPPTVLVPADTLVRDGGGTSVFVVEGDSARRVAVTLGPERQGSVVVTSGLTGDERIVARPDRRLRDGGGVVVR